MGYQFGSCVERQGAGRRLAPALIVLAACMLGGCSLPVADLPVVGLPANTPPRPETPAAYLPVHDIPAPREENLLTADQQAQMEKELAAARDRQSAIQRQND
ncbi:hypothetical protein ACSVBT_10035 [Afipia sp. TerB]